MERGRRLLIAVAVFVIVFTVHFESPVISVADSRYSIHTTLIIVRQGNTDLDEYRDIIPADDYRVEIVGGHLYSIFPVGTSLLAAPVVFLADVLSGPLSGVDLDTVVRSEVPAKIELFIACLIVALSTVVVEALAYEVCRRRRCSLLIAFIFAFCTSAWSTASRGLWQHGPSILMLSVALYLIVAARRRPHLIQYAGLALAFSVVIRPTNVLSVLVLTLYIFLEHRRYLVRYLVAASLVAIPFFVYNSAIYQALLPPYYTPQALGSNRFFADAFVGNLVSPARGLLVFSPIFLLVALDVAGRIRQRRMSRLDLTLLFIIFLHVLAVSSYYNWWGGHSLGPRFFSDMIPYLTYLLIPVAIRLTSQPRHTPWLAVTTVVLLSISFLAHARSATSMDVYFWNAIPSNVDRNQARLWDWRDVQFLRGIKTPLSVAPSPGFPETAAAADLAAAHGPSIIFDNTLQLLGYTLLPDTVSPGQKATLVLYWKVMGPKRLDPTVTVWLLDRFGTAPVQDTFVLVNGFATSAWDSTTVYVARRVLSIPPNTATGFLPLEMSVWDRQQGSDVAPSNQVGLGGLLVGQPSIAASVDVASSTQVDAVFGDSIVLRGFSMPPASMRAGETIHLTLYWQLQQPVQRNYTVFVHILDASGQLVAQKDNEPNAGQYPTAAWQMGQPVRDAYALALPEGLAQGAYRIVVGLYEWPSLQRLAVTVQGTPRGDSMTLADFIVGR